MAAHTLDIPTFRATYPEFADPVKYTDAAIEAQFALTGIFVSVWDGPFLCGPDLDACLMAMTAHLMKLSAIAAAGGTAGIVTASTVDKVSVTLKAPPIKDGWEFWLSQTPYGQMLWAMLIGLAAGGFYIGGRPEQAAFRKVGGRFF